MPEVKHPYILVEIYEEQPEQWSAAEQTLLSLSEQLADFAAKLQIDAGSRSPKSLAQLRLLADRAIMAYLGEQVYES